MIGEGHWPAVISDGGVSIGDGIGRISGYMWVIGNESQCGREAKNFAFWRGQ